MAHQEALDDSDADVKKIKCLLKAHLRDREIYDVDGNKMGAIEFIETCLLVVSKLATWDGMFPGPEDVVKGVLAACRRVYPSVHLINEDNTSKKDAYSEEDLRKLYCPPQARGNMTTRHTRGIVEVRGLRLCSTNGVRMSMRLRKTPFVDRDVNAAINIFKAACAGGGSRPAYLTVVRRRRGGV